MQDNYDVKLTEREALIIQTLIEEFEAEFHRPWLRLDVAVTEKEYIELRNKFF